MEIQNENDKIQNDDFFGKKPGAYFLPAVRLLLLCLMSGSFVMMICELYEFTGDRWGLTWLSAGVSGIVFILASLLPSGIVYGGIIAAEAGVIWLFRERVFHYLQYFWDLLMVRLDSRLVDTTRMFIHDPVRMKSGLEAVNSEMETSFLIIMRLAIVLIAVIFTSSVRTRFRLTAPVLLATAAIAPCIAAERAGYIPSFFVYIVCIFGLEIVTSSEELNLGFTFGHLPAARMSEHRSDAAYHRRTRFLLFGKKLELDADRYHKHAANSAALAVAAALVFFGVAAAVPDGKGISYQQVFNIVERLGYQAADAVGSIFGTTFGTSDDRGYFSSSGYNDIGSSISIAPPGNSDLPVLEVQLSRNDVPVYLRGDIGVDYHNNAWSGIKTVDAQYRAAVPENFYPENEYQMFRKYLAYTFSIDMPDEVMPLQMVSLRYLRSTKVIFQPLAAYELNYRTNPQYECYSDFILRAKQGYVKNYNTLSLTPNIEKYADLIFTDGSGSPRTMNSYWTMGIIEPPEGMTPAEYADAMDGYKQYIMDTFRVSSPEIKQFIEELGIPEDYAKLTAEYGVYYGYYRYDTAKKICDYFAKNFTYSLDTDNGADQLSGFLYDTRSGHCALFATAMTLALREMGIPARYVTGYVAEGPGEPIKDGFRYVLTEKQLHAWTEVYFNGIGWVAFDPTAGVPGYAELVAGEWDGTGDHDYGKATTPAETAPPIETTNPEPSETEISERPTPEITEGADTTAPPEEEDAPGSDPSSTAASGGKDIFVFLLPYLVAVTIIIALAVITIMFGASLKRSEKQVIQSFRKLPPAEAAAIMYRFVLVLLEKKGLKPEYEQFYDFAERVDGSIEMKGLNMFMMDVMPVFEKCEFGNAEISPVTEEERAAVYRFTMAVYNKVMADYSGLKRFFVKISLFL